LPKEKGGRARTIVVRSGNDVRIETPLSLKGGLLRNSKALEMEGNASRKVNRRCGVKTLRENGEGEKKKKSTGTMKKRRENRTSRDEGDKGHRGFERFPVVGEGNKGKGLGKRGESLKSPGGNQSRRRKRAASLLWSTK